MASLNRVLLIGNLGGDPVSRKTNSDEVVNFSLATKESYTDKDGKKVEKTEWHRIVVWGKLAANCQKFLFKGNAVCVEGKIQTRKYTKDGVDHWATDIIAQNVQFLTPKKDTSEHEQHQKASDTTAESEFDFSQIPF